ncbi:MAG: MarR family transcriptional regulator [Hyphomicrobiales bacterium]|nr:MarR family transcriptional regulator [Hyphomicrobiales bacterium]
MADDAGVNTRHLDEIVGYMLRRAQVAVFNDFRRMFADYAVTPTQYAVLCLIADNPGSNQSRIAAALGIKRANFVAILDELERRDLAAREPSNEDRRSHALRLTAQGESFTTALRKRNAEADARVDALLQPGERAMLIDVLQRLSTGLGDADSGSEG